MRSKKYFTILFCLILTTMLTLNVQASDMNQLQTLQEELALAMEEAGQITQALDAGESADNIAAMLDNIEDLDTYALAVSDETPEEAPETGSLGDFSSESSSSAAFLLAQMQMEMANSIKNDAVRQIDNVREIQAQQTLTSNYIEQARELMSQSESSGEPAAIPGNIQYFIDENGLSYPSSESGLYDASGWQEIIYTLENHLDELG